MAICKNRVRERFNLMEEICSFVRKNQCGFKGFGLFGIHKGITDKDYHISWRNKPGCCPIEGYFPTVSGAGNNISFKPCTIVVVYHLDFLTFYNVGGIHQILINSYAAYII